MSDSLASEIIEEPEKLNYIKQSELTPEQKEHNEKYAAEANHQLTEWVEGRPFHNTLSCYCQVVDEDGKMVGVTNPHEDGECCPDFSCCYPEGMWDKEKRELYAKAFVDDPDLACRMLMDGFKGLAIASGCNVVTSEDVINGTHEVQQSV